MLRFVLDKRVKGNPDALAQRVSQLDPNTKWEVVAKPYKSQRSLDQNSRLWSLYTALGNHLGYTAEEIHALMGWKFLREQKTINGYAVEITKSTTKLNTQEMTDYLNAIERWAAELGFVWECE